MEYKYNSIEDIYNRLKDIIANPKNESLDLLGSYIVGCTFVLDDIKKYFADYPVLEEIAELGAELETIDDISYQNMLMSEIKSKIITFGAIIKKNE